MSNRVLLRYSVVFESLHSHLSDGIRAHHKSVLRPGYRCLNNGRDVENLRPLCLDFASYVPISLVCYVTTRSRGWKKGPKLAGQPYAALDRKREMPFRPCP